MSREELNVQIQQAALARALLDSLHPMSRKAANRAGLSETGPAAAEKYWLRHPAVQRPSSLRRILRHARIEAGQRPLRYPTPTKRERTIARKQKARDARA